MFGYIYKTTNKINGKIYIGQKMSDFFLGDQYLGSGKYLKNAIQKYGKENFVVEQIDRADNKNDLNEKEKYWIKFYNSTDDKIGYNISLGGDGGDTWSNLNSADKNQRIKKAQNSVFKKFGKLSPCKGRKWMVDNNGNYIVVEPEEVAYYESIGYKKQGSSKGKKIPEESKLKMRKAALERAKKGGYSNKGKVLVHNDSLGQQKYVLSDELDEYLQNGWSKGQSKKNHKKCSQETIEKLRVSHLGQKPKSAGKIKINNGVIAKYIEPSELCDYISLGWEKGALPFTEEHRKNLSAGNKNNPNIFNFKGYKYINNGVDEKRVSPLELDRYFKEGWKLGRINNYFPNHIK